MGFLDLFKRNGREERSRQRLINKALNKYSQSADRFRALQGLADDGSPEAIYGLLRRFGIVYDKSIEDEQEKEWVFEVLVSKGALVLPQVKRYLASAESISWPLRVLAKVAPSKAEELAMVKDELERHEVGYERDPTKKIQLLTHLASLREPGVPALVAPYLEDMDEGVRYIAVETLLRLKDEDAAREPLLNLFESDKEESLRIRIRIADGFAELGWLVYGHRGLVEKKLPDQFQLDREGHIKRKPEATRP